MEKNPGAVPADRRYTPEHLWVLQEADGAFLAGITDFAQDQLGEVVYVGLPGAGECFAAGEGFGVAESMKSSSTLHMPVAGEVLAVNAALEDSPALVNSAPYAEGWILRIRPDDPKAADGLLGAADYAALAQAG